MRNSESGRKRASYHIRKGQLFGPWGIGAIVPCPGDESIMIAGLDQLSKDDVASLVPVDDMRLARLIGVERLLEPPEEESGILLRAVRFPGWLYCPACGKMKHLSPTSGYRNPYCDSEGCKGKNRSLIPERFIVACPEGHIDDFPFIEWVHQGKAGDEGRHVLTRTTRGGMATMGDIVYSCSCGAERSLRGASVLGSLASVGYCCHGNRPWLSNKRLGCHAPEDGVRVVQRGGNNIWYADIVSSISIPDGQNPKVQEVLTEYLDQLLSFYGQGEPSLDLFVSVIADKHSGVSTQALKNAFLQRLNEDASTSQGDEDYRAAEYAVLTNPDGQGVPGVFEEIIRSSEEYCPDALAGPIKRIGAVKTLRETRALVGFSRLNPDANVGVAYQTRRKMLSAKPINWTFATQLTGEGIFIELDEGRLEEWEARAEVMGRFEAMQKNFDRAQDRYGKERAYVNPRYVLIHSLAHALMRALATECGYSVASVRERIYCDKHEVEHPHMNGLLLYTASSDSEGSLGGLVRAGSPGRFERILERALREACWCSSDPVCIESSGQGPDSCNLAACYCCSLVPETSCEVSNKFLDRAALVGTLERRECGLFGFIREGERGSAQ